MSADRSLSALRRQALARWRALAPRERTGLTVAGVAIAALLAWLVLLQPAWRTLRDAPLQLDTLDAQLQQLQRLAAESRSLRAAPPVALPQAAEALQAATARLGDGGRIAITGDRATLSLKGVGADLLVDWLADARSAARARPVEAQLTRSGQGYSGTLVVQLGSGA
jgi:general secretion pathway protein M